ncbi:hypothetical protein [Caldanaerobius polysaccharolyticus]|uniref:hypothetical protein n=1 Tax=Caldanaerobius polysaccharolyticus TaxID=44256 RepID=UPI00047AF680|nr:hypothetical protein [Caldanaerobius polysaccharolyticus]
MDVSLWDVFVSSPFVPEAFKFVAKNDLSDKSRDFCMALLELAEQKHVPESALVVALVIALMSLYQDAVESLPDGDLEKKIVKAIQEDMEKEEARE